MRTLILSILILVFLTSCKKTYNCTCEGYSVRSHLFTEAKPVSATTEKKAKDACIKKFEDYGSQYNLNDPDGLSVVICDLK